MKRIIRFLKDEIVMVIAWILAIISMFFLTPSKEYLSYIDFKTLGLLLSLMFVTAGLKECRVFEKIGNELLNHTKGLRSLKVVLVFLCFFSAMLITNDVALITFVPFSLYVLKRAGYEKSMISVVALQTIAANLGSMMTPFGNPQNLYLFSESGMTALDFFRITIPYVLVAAVMLFGCCIFGKKEEKKSVLLESISINKKKTMIYAGLFVLCIVTVFGILPYYITLFIVLLLALFLEKSLYRKVDYSLILTFIGFFIFIGNVGKMESVQTFLSEIIDGREILVSVLSSQVISNVPAALLLSTFTKRYDLLLVGLNLGGLGTLIASMASLISYKILVKDFSDKKGIYIGTFTLYSLVFLAALGMVAFSI